MRSRYTIFYGFLALLFMLNGHAELDEGALYADYNAVLATHVDDEGLVNYAALKADRILLDRFVQRLGEIRQRDYEVWAQEAQVAFWVNAYNALSLKIVIDHYPIKANWKTRLLYPANSIRQIPGAWKKIHHRVIGQELTVYAIENEMLRKNFDTPDIHMALVCASQSCPVLQQVAFNSENFKRLIRRAGEEFFTNSDKFLVDISGKRVGLTSIFKWFPKDFDSYAEGGVSGPLRYAAQFLPPDQAAFLMAGQYRSDYLKYDWSLNEQKMD